MNTSLIHRFSRLALINILSNITVPLAGLVDVAFLGHLAEVRYLAGVALATVLFDYIFWTFGFLRMGTTGTTAQAVGRQDHEEVLLVGLRHCAIALFLGIVILILQYPLRELGFLLLQGTEAVKAVSRTYYDARIWGSPATLLNFVFIGWFLGREQSSRVLMMTIVGNSTNVILDYLMIAKWGWGGAGAGWATAISQYLMLLVGIVLALRELRSMQVEGVSRQLFAPAALKAIFGLNGNLLIRTFALISTFALFTNLSSAMGTAVLATNAVLLQVVTLAAYFIDGFAFATESLAGIFWGEGAGDRLKHLLWLSGGASLFSGLAFALIFILLPGPLFGFLTNHTEVTERIIHYTLWLIPVLGFGSIAYMLDGYFLGLTEGSILRQSTLTAALIGFAPAALVAQQLHNIQILWLALALFMVIRAVTLVAQVPRTLEMSQSTIASNR